MPFSPGLRQPGQSDDTLKGIQETHPRVPVSGVHQLINFWHGKRVLRACSVQVREIHTNPPFVVLLPNDHGIC